MNPDGPAYPLSPRRSAEVFDAAVVGAGVVGCAVVRRLALAGLRVVLLERAPDILAGASKANSALLHTGFDAPPGSLELACMRAGYAEYLQIRERLGLPLLETGAVVVAWSEADLARLEGIAAQARGNGVADVQMLRRDELLAREPCLSGACHGGLLVPGEHVIDPWSAPLAYARQALAHGAEVRFDAEVTGGDLERGQWTLQTTAGAVIAGYVVNCAGLFGDVLEQRLLGDSAMEIRPRKGQFVVFDKAAARLLRTTVLPVPSERTKGVVLARTIFGNLLVGPTAEEQDDRERAAVKRATLLHHMGYAQELARRMHVFSNFAISFSIICILAGGITAFPVAYSAGGPFSVVIGWAIGGLFALIVGLSMAQIASAYPTAGGLYHWASILGGRGYGWVCAWINLLGLIFVVASVNVGTYLLFKDLVVAGVFGFDSSAWGLREQVVAVSLIALSQGLFNHYGIRTTTAITDFSGYLILVVAVLLTLTFLAWGATFDLSRLTLFVNNTGEAGGGFYPEPRTMLVAFLVGLLYPVYTITGFDASAHTSEETIDARRSVPRGIFHSIFWSLAFGLIMAVAFVLAIPDLAAAAKDGANSWFNLFNNLPAPKLLKDLLAIGIVLANYCCALAGLTSISRMVFAFARDGGLPASHILRRVSPVHRTPVPAIWTCAALSVAVTLYSPAFAALAVGCAMFLYVSYAFPIAAGIVAEGKSWTEFGPFRLGIWSKPVALIVLIGTLFVVYAGIQPPFDILINYAVGLLILLLVIWFGFERKRFQGPPIGDMIARRQAEIRAAERAVGEAAH